MKQRPDLNKLSKQVYKANKAKGFHDKEHSDEVLLMLVITELSEAVEADRKGYFHYFKKYGTKEVPASQEEWRAISGYEGRYAVSNLGRVKSLDREVFDKGHGTFWRAKGKLLSPGLSKTGYHTVSLSGKTHKVSILVATAFLNKSDGNQIVNHIDGNKKNNNVSNLEWVSYSQNSIHAYRSGLKQCSKKWIIPYNDRCAIAFKKKSGINYTTIFKQASYGVTKSAIQRICKEYVKYTDSVEMELADAVIRLLDLAGLRGIDIKIMRGGYFNISPIFAENIFHFVSLCHHSEIQFYGERIGRIISQIEYYCQHLNIDMWRHVELKLAYNKTREKRHGKRY